MIWGRATDIRLWHALEAFRADQDEASDEALEAARQVAFLFAVGQALHHRGEDTLASSDECASAIERLREALAKVPDPALALPGASRPRGFVACPGPLEWHEWEDGD